MASTLLSMGTPLKSAFTILNNQTVTANGVSSNYFTGIYKNLLGFIYVSSASGTVTIGLNAYDPTTRQSVLLASNTITSTGAYYIAVNNYAGQWFNLSWSVNGTFTLTIVVYESW
jgi:hypothetical protein